MLPPESCSIFCLAQRFQCRFDFFFDQQANLQDVRQRGNPRRQLVGDEAHAVGERDIGFGPGAFDIRRFQELLLAPPEVQLLLLGDRDLLDGARPVEGVPTKNSIRRFMTVRISSLTCESSFRSVRQRCVG